MSAKKEPSRIIWNMVRKLVSIETAGNQWRVLDSGGKKIMVVGTKKLLVWGSKFRGRPAWPKMQSSKDFFLLLNIGVMSLAVCT